VCCQTSVAGAARFAYEQRVSKRPIRYWLMKSEPDVYSIADLEKQKVGTWEGVRNYQARNHMRAMQAGDLALFYHSSATPSGVAGLMRIVKEAYVDETQFDKKSDYYDAQSKPDAPRWDRVDVGYLETFSRFVPLEELKSDPRCEGMLVIKRGMRLSVQPVEKKHFAHILKLAQSKARA
jgi:predicted RNA-binding protein with PUA-like domain